MAMQPPLDDARSAKQPQAQDMDGDTFGALVAGLREHIFGKGEQGIVKAMQEADDPGRVLGELTYALVKEAAHQAVEQGGREVSIDMLIGVATEVIDDISEMLAAMGMQIDDKQREFALLYAQQLYVESTEPSDDERNAAKQQLAQMHESGKTDKAVSYIQQRGMEAGTDPFGVSQMTGEKPKMMGR